MRIKTFPLGSYKTNCYLVWNDQKEAALFDCGDPKIENLVKFIDEHGLALKYIILTHGHGDHIGGLNEIKKLYPKAEIAIGKEDREFLTDPVLSLVTAIHGFNFTYTGDVILLSGGEDIFGFEVIDTPGHTVGSKCFYNRADNFMITGDTLFKQSYGRYDLPTGNLLDLKDSLKKICENYPGDTIIYSGHTASTTLSEEKKELKSEGMI